LPEVPNRPPVNSLKSYGGSGDDKPTLVSTSIPVMTKIVNRKPTLVSEVKSENLPAESTRSESKSKQPSTFQMPNRASVEGRPKENHRAGKWDMWDGRSKLAEAPVSQTGPRGSVIDPPVRQGRASVAARVDVPSSPSMIAAVPIPSIMPLPKTPTTDSPSQQGEIPQLPRLPSEPLEAPVMVVPSSRTSISSSPPGLRSTPTAEFVKPSHRISQESKSPSITSKTPDAGESVRSKALSIAMKLQAHQAKQKPNNPPPPRDPPAS